MPQVTPERFREVCEKHGGIVRQSCTAMVASWGSSQLALSIINFRVSPLSTRNSNAKAAWAELTEVAKCPHCDGTSFIVFDSLGIWSDRRNTWVNYSKGDKCPCQEVAK